MECGLERVTLDALLLLHEVAASGRADIAALERFPPDVNQFISGDSLAAANQILSAIIGGGGDGGKGVFDGLERSCGGLG